VDAPGHLFPYRVQQAEGRQSARLAERNTHFAFRAPLLFPEIHYFDNSGNTVDNERLT
jgi:hypothetical protein